MLGWRFSCEALLGLWGVLITSGILVWKFSCEALLGFAGYNYEWYIGGEGSLLKLYWGLGVIITSGILGWRFSCEALLGLGGF